MYCNYIYSVRLRNICSFSVLRLSDENLPKIVFLLQDVHTYTYKKERAGSDNYTTDQYNVFDHTP